MKWKVRFKLVAKRLGLFARPLIATTNIWLQIYNFQPQKGYLQPKLSIYGDYFQPRKVFFVVVYPLTHIKSWNLILLDQDQQRSEFDPSRPT